MPGFLFVFILLLIINSCTRYDVITKSNPINVSETRAWLQKNGMAYKNEAISVQATNGALLTGKLNWKKARQYNWEGRDYVAVPFEFETKVESEGTKSQFAMVIRHGDEEAFEAALRVITYNPEAENLIKGDSNSLYAQTYEQLDGTPANAWVADNAGGKAISANRVFFTTDQIAQLRARVKASGKDKTLPRSAGGDCRIDEVVTYAGNCNYWGGERLGVVVQLCKNTRYLMTCSGFGGGAGSFGGVPVPTTPTPVRPPYPPGTIDEFKEVDDEDREPEEDPINDCVTLPNMKKIFPGTPDAQLQKVIDQIKEYAKDFNIDSKAKLSHLIAQMAHETENFTRFEENKQFRIERLSETWSSLFNPTSNPTANPKKANPNDFKESPGSIWASQEKLLNYVYGNAKNRSLGNDQPGDGYKYRGRGGMHLTGKYNYQKFTEFYNVYCNGACSNFVQEPGLIGGNIETAILSGLWYFNERINKNMTINDNTSVEAVTIKINSGQKGIEERKKIFKDTKTAMKDC